MAFPDRRTARGNQREFILGETLVLIDNIYQFFKKTTRNRKKSRSTVRFEEMRLYLESLEHSAEVCWRYLTTEDIVMIRDSLHECFESISDRPQGVFDAFATYVVPQGAFLKTVIARNRDAMRDKNLDIRASVTPNCRKFFPPIKKDKPE